MSLELQALKFTVDTTELKDAADKVGQLAASVNNLKSSLKNLPKVTLPSVQASGSSGSNSSVNSTGPGSARANSGMKTFNTLMDDLSNLQRDLVDGFTRGESGWLKQARAIQLNTDQMNQYKNKIREVSELFKDPFDSSLGSLRAVTKEFERLNTRAELLSKGIFLSTNQLKEFSRLSSEVKGAMLADGKKVNSKGMFEGNDLTEYTRKLEIVRESYLKTAAANNQLEQAEKIRLKESARLEQEKARLISEGERMMQGAVEQFRKNEQTKQAELQRTLQITEQLEQKTALLKQGYSRGEATTLVSGLSKGVDRGTLDALIAAQRENSNVMGKSSTAADGSAKAARELAKANQYLIDVEARLDEALKHTNDSMDRRSTDQLVKIRNALKVTGQATETAGSKFDILSKKVEQVASKEQERRLQYLARAISVQMGDVGISLASGMNPLLVMIQQGDQIRGAIQQSGAAGKELERAMSTAAVQIASSFRDTGKAIGGFFVSAIMGAGSAVSSLAINFTGADEVLRKMNNSLLVSSALGNKTASVFLGMANAAKVMIGVLAVTLIAALAALPIALYKVIKMEDDFTRSITISGGAMGLTATSAYAYAASLEHIGSTSSSAFEAMKEMGKTGTLTAKEISLVAGAAVELNKIGGVAIADTVKTFADLKKDPVEALIKVARETGMVSVETIRMVEELELAGRTTDAQALAMQTYGDVTAKQIKRMKEEYSDFAMFIKTLSITLAQFWDDAFAGWFKKADPKVMMKNKMNDLDKQIADAKAQMDPESFRNKTLDFFGASDPDRAAQKAHLEELVQMRLALVDQFTALGQVNAAEQKNSEEEVRRAALFKDAQEAREKGYSKESKFLAEINKLAAKRTEALALGLPKEAQTFTDAILAKVKEHNEQGNKRNKVDDDYNRILNQAKDLYESRNGALEEYTQSQVAVLKIINDPVWKSFNDTQRMAIMIEFKKALIADENVKHSKEALEAQKKINDAWTKTNKEWEKRDDDLIKAIDTQDKLNEALDEETKKLAFESSSLFTTDEQRKRTLKTIDADIALRKELLEIQKDYEKHGDKSIKEEGENQAQARYRQRMLNINTEIVNDQMKKWVDMYNNLQTGIADAISTALFEGGKAGRKKLRDIIVAELRKPIELYIKAGVEILTQGGNGFVQALMSNDVASNSNNSTTMINGASAGAKALSWGKEVYGGYQSGGLSGAWSAGTGAGGTVGVNASTGAYTSMANGQVLSAYGVEGAGASAGTSAGVYALYAAAIYAGVKKAMGDWKEGFRTDSVKNLSDETGGLGGMESSKSQLFQALGMNQKWADLFSGATAVAKHFGMADAKLEKSGVQGNFTAGQFSGKSFQDIYQKGGILRKSKWWTELTELPSDVNNLMGEIAKSTHDSVVDFAGTLGLVTDQIDSVRTEIKVAISNKNLKDLSEKYGEDLSKPFEQLSEAGKKIARSSEFTDALRADEEANLKELTNAAMLYSSAMVDTFKEQLKPFSKYGEEAIVTIERLSTNLKAVNVVMKDLGLTSMEASLAGADAAGNFIALFGGISEFNSAFSTYYEGFYTAEEKLQSRTTALKTSFDELGVAVPTSIAAFKELVTAASAAGDTSLVASLVKLSGAFLDIQQVTDETVVKVTGSDVLNTFSEMADKFLNPTQLKDFRLGEIVETLAKSGIIATKEMLSAATSTDVFNAALEFFNAGMYDKAQLVLGIVDKLSSVSDKFSFGPDPEIKKAADLYDAAKIKLEASKVAVQNAYDAQIKGVDNTIDSIQKEIDVRNKAADAAQKNVDKFKELVDKFTDFKKAISDLRKEFVSEIIGAQIGKQPAAMQGLTDAAKRAKGGDVNALQDIQKYSKEYVDLSKDNSVTFLDYAKDIMTVNSILTGVESSADVQIRQNAEAMAQAQLQVDTAMAASDTATKQLEEAQASRELLIQQKDAALAQIDATLGVGTSVLSVADAIANMSDAIAGFKMAQQDAAVALGNMTVKTKGGEVAGVADYSGSLVVDTIKTNIAAGYTPDYILSEAVRAYGANADDIRNIARLAGIPGFVTGGSYDGGLAMVGEAGKELINFDRPGQVYNASQTKDLLRPDTSDSDLRTQSLLQTLIIEIQKAGADSSKIRKIFETLTPEGDSLVIRFVDTQAVNVV